MWAEHPLHPNVSMCVLPTPSSLFQLINAKGVLTNPSLDYRHGWLRGSKPFPILLQRLGVRGRAAFVHAGRQAGVCACDH